MQGSGIICFLSGLEIPAGRVTHEHAVPLSRYYDFITKDKRNIFYAHKKINEIKGNLLLCEWEEQKVKLCKYALKNYSLKYYDKKFIIRTLDRFATEKEKLNPCQYCLLSTQKEFCYEARGLEEYRVRWLSGKQSR